MKVLFLTILSLLFWTGVALAQGLDGPYSLWLQRPLPTDPQASGSSAYSDSLGNTGMIQKNGPFYNVFPAPRPELRGGLDLGREADRLTDFLNDQYQMDHGVTPWGTVSKDPWGFRMQRDR